LSFGGEAEDDEEELESAVQVLKSKHKSAHDIGDPNLLSKKVYEASELSNRQKTNESESESESSDGNEIPEKKLKPNESLDMSSIKAKLKKNRIDDPKLNDKDDKKEVVESKLSAKELKKLAFFLKMCHSFNFLTIFFCCGMKERNSGRDSTIAERDPGQ
jgi:hypothetical protein